MLLLIYEVIQLAFCESKFPQISNNKSKINIRVVSVPKLEEAIENLLVENPRKSQNRLMGLMKNQQNVKKTLRFSENGNVYRLVKSRHSHGSSDSSNGDKEAIEEVEEIGVFLKEIGVEDEDSLKISENEMDPRKNLGTRMNHSTKNHRSDQEHNEEDDK